MPKKRLTRSRYGIVGGVCRGVADYFNLDPSLVRIITVLGMILAGLGIWVYLIFWLIIPLGVYEEAEYRESPFNGSQAQNSKFDHKKWHGK